MWKEFSSAPRVSRSMNYVSVIEGVNNFLSTVSMIDGTTQPAVRERDGDWHQESSSINTANQSATVKNHEKMNYGIEILRCLNELIAYLNSSPEKKKKKNHNHEKHVRDNWE